MKIVIIGSGMAGLTAGAYLARRGHRITIFEQYAHAGGVTATVAQDGFSWDLGPLLLEGFGPGEAGTRILRETGALDSVGFVTGDRGIVFPDFDLWKPAQFSGSGWRRARLEALFPEEREGIAAFYTFEDQVRRLLADANALEASRGMRRLASRLRLLGDFRPLRRWKDASAQALLDHFFTSDRLKAVFSAILADMVVRPDEFPALGVPGLNLETAFESRVSADAGKPGHWPHYRYIAGGCGNLVEAMAAQVRGHGGRIICGNTVSRIDVERGRARGVRLSDGHVEAADLVLATGGYRETFEGLLDGEPPVELRALMDRITPMESVLMVHLGVDTRKAAPQQSALCYYYGIYDIAGGVERCRSGEYHEGRDGFLIYVPSMHSPEMAPAGHQAVTIYTIAPNVLDRGNWEERREELADKLVDEAEKHLPGLRKGEVTRLVVTPADFRTRVHQHHHSFGGTAPVMGVPTPPHRTHVKGVWFLGSQSESGGGVVGVMKGARTVASTIEPRIGSERE